MKMTNALKGAIVAAVNQVLVTAALFGAPISDAQTAGVGACVNAMLVVWIMVTRKDSPRWKSDQDTVESAETE